MGARLLGFVLGAAGVFGGLIAATRYADSAGVLLVCVAAAFVMLVVTAVIAHRRSAVRMRDLSASAAAGVASGTGAFFALVVWALSQFQ